MPFKRRDANDRFGWLEHPGLHIRAGDLTPHAAGAPIWRDVQDFHAFPLCVKTQFAIFKRLVSFYYTLSVPWKKFMRARGAERACGTSGCGESQKIDKYDEDR
jgi:hypothetical protein